MSEEATKTDGASPARPRDEDHPLVFARRWRALALLGSGGMGSVYLARDSELGELVALKTVRDAAALDPGAIERFRDEVRLARRVSSPYVARTHDLGEDGESVFLTMQYVEGEALSARLKRDGAMRFADVVRLAHDVAAGLDAVHAAGVVHRDLKPGNVMLAKDGTAVLTDFGIALGTSGAAITDRSGTPTYTAPEQLAGRAVDRRADVFAFGALLYAAATGKRPFTAARTGAEAPPDPREVVPSIPDAFRTVVMRAMALDPAERFASAGELYAALAPLACARTTRSESALFDFVRSLTAGARQVTVAELRGDDARVPLRNVVRSHLVARLQHSGEIAESPLDDATEAILDGSVAEVDGECVLDLELRSRDGDAFWRRSFHAPLRSLASMVETAAAAAAGALAASCTRDVTPAFASAEAAELFLTARDEYRTSWITRARHALELFARVDALAPNHPSVLAWRALASARVRFSDDAVDRGHQLVERALEVGGEREPEARLALAQIALQDMRVVDSLREALVALRLAPGLVDARMVLAHLLDELGAPLAAVKLANALLAAGGENPEMLGLLMRDAGLRGRPDECVALARRIPRDSPAFVRIALTLFRQAVWHRDPSLAIEPEGGADAVMNRTIETARAVLAGRPPPSLADLEPMLAHVSPRRRALVAQNNSELHAFRGDDDSFFAWLDRAVAFGVFDSSWIDGCPLFAPYRGVVHFESARRTIHARALDALNEAERVLAAPLDELVRTTRT